MAKGARSSRRKAPLRGQAEVAPPSDPPRGPNPIEAQPIVAIRATTLAGRQKEQVEDDPSEREEYLSDKQEDDYNNEDERSPAAQEFEISENDVEDDVIMDNLAPIGVGVAGGSKPPTKVDKVPWKKRPAKERRPKERPRTTNAPEKTPSFMESLTNEERHIYLALDANKEAQMLYILNLGKEGAKGTNGHWSMGRGLVQVNQLPTPPTYDGAHEQSGQKFRQWLTTMEVHLQACAEPSMWASVAAPYLQDYALTWYKAWKSTQEPSSLPLTWKDLVEVKLPPLLREKLQDKQHEFKQLMDAFDRATTLVNNRPGLAKVGGKAGPEEGEGRKPKFDGQKRKQSEGLSNSEIISKGESTHPRKVFVLSPRLRGMNWHKRAKMKGIASKVATSGTSSRTAQRTGQSKALMVVPRASK
ncbi:unnamed protein product [Calypogeia fissa]